jgi:hypothetical protein
MNDETAELQKFTAKYQFNVPPISVAQERIHELEQLEPIRLATQVGHLVIHPLTCKEPKGGHWEKVDTLCIDLGVEATQSIEEKELLDRLDKEMRNQVIRFLRLIRRKLPETPFSVPSADELVCRVSYEWEKPPEGWQLVGSYGPFTARVLPNEAGITSKRWQELAEEFTLGLDTELWEDFLLDAKVALGENDLNRAILYAAIACEIFIKEYTEKSAKEKGISQIFWEYLKDPNTETKVRAYYDQVLHLVKGHSMKRENKEIYNRLDRIFQARNKIMHEGKIPPSWNRNKINELGEDIRKVEQIISWVQGL